MCRGPALVDRALPHGECLSKSALLHNTSARALDLAVECREPQRNGFHDKDQGQWNTPSAVAEVAVRLTVCGRPVPEVPNGPLVISAGWGRTGTSSLKEALDDMGLAPCFHARFFPYLTELFEGMWDVARGATRLEEFDARRLFRPFNAAVDIPGPIIPRVLQAYPDAKVILTIRDSDKWYESYVNSLLWLYQTWLFHPFSYFGMGVKLHGVARWWLIYMFGVDNMDDKAACIAAYERHNAWVKATVPTDCLLVWKPQDGWEPLCRFLEVPVPERPFPRSNEGVRAMAMQIVRFILRNPLEALGFRKYCHKGGLRFSDV